MAKRPGKGKPQHQRVDFRRNRQKPGRRKQWALPTENDPEGEDTHTHESVRARGELSRKRTVVDHGESAAEDTANLRRGAVIAVRGQFVEVEHDREIWMCTVRRVLRTRSIRERHPVVTGDEVFFTVLPESTVREGVIHTVLPRRTALHRSDGKRHHVIAANVDQVLVVSSIFEPMIKPHLIDRYLVAIHSGGPQAIVCINKVDLDQENLAAEILAGYAKIGYSTLATSIHRPDTVESLRELLRNRITMMAGQSGVGKSSLINAIQPGLNLKTAHVSVSTEKGRHTTTTAVWYRLDMGGAIIDTPGIRAFDLAMIPLQELEAHFVEFLERIPHCKFPNCVHIHEDGCAVKRAVESGDIDLSRYESYVQVFMERSESAR